MDFVVGSAKGAWLAYYNELNPCPFAQLANCVLAAGAMLTLNLYALAACAGGAAAASLEIWELAGAAIAADVLAQHRLVFENETGASTRTTVPGNILGTDRIRGQYAIEISACAFLTLIPDDIVASTIIFTPPYSAESFHEFSRVLVAEYVSSVIDFLTHYWQTDAASVALAP